VPSATIVALVIASMEAGKHLGRITGRTGQASLRARQDLRLGCGFKNSRLQASQRPIGTLGPGSTCEESATD